MGAVSFRLVRQSADGDPAVVVGTYGALDALREAARTELRRAHLRRYATYFEDMGGAAELVSQLREIEAYVQPGVPVDLELATPPPVAKDLDQFDAEYFDALGKIDSWFEALEDAPQGQSDAPAVTILTQDEYQELLVRQRPLRSGEEEVSYLQFQLVGVLLQPRHVSL